MTIPVRKPAAATRAWRLAALWAAALTAAAPAMAGGPTLEQRSQEVRAFIDSVVGIDSLRIPADVQDFPLPLLPNGEPDPFYAVTPERVELGRLLFHDPALSRTSHVPGAEMTVSCATCHFVEAGFRAGQTISLGVGGRGFLDASGRSVRRPAPSLLAANLGPTPPFNQDMLDNPGVVSPSINMVSFFSELNWNGSQTSFGPGELPAVERQVRQAIDLHRMNDFTAIRQNPTYVALFLAAFPEEAGGTVEQLIELAQVIRAIGAFERTVVSDHAPWDAFLAGSDTAMTMPQLAGADLFFGQANCFACHHGPALGETAYYALGTADHPWAAGPDLGRFNVTQLAGDEYSFRAMGVRQLKHGGPLFHGGSAATLADVVRYKNAGVPQQGVPTISPLFTPLGLSEAQIDDLVAFLSDGLYDPDMERFSTASVPSGLCVPNDDLPSRFDAGCRVFGDADGDGDVDIADYAEFSDCLAGPGVMPPGPCVSFDRNGDEAVDLFDFAAFQRSP